MSDLISRQAAIDAINRYFVNPPEYMMDYADRLLHAIKEDLVDDINSLPSAQPERNSVCGWNAIICETAVFGMPYCPHCGAKMESE